MKLSEDLLQKIKEGKPVDTNMIPGHISTPKMPGEVYNIEYNQDGTEFKRTIDADRWIDWINSVAVASADENADITLKSIVNSSFYDNCHFAYMTITKHIKDINGEKHSGAFWSEGGHTYSVSLINDQITRAIDALVAVNEHSIVAKSNNIFAPKTALRAMMDPEAARDIINGRI